MPEYTYKDVIIDPEDPRLEGAIGKEVYHSNYPVLCLDYANEDKETVLGKLDNIYRKNGKPFISNEYAWICIIIKKEDPKPEYVPFESVDEFLDAYENSTYSIDCGSVENELLNRGGIWLKYKATDTRLVVTEMWGNGLTIGSDTAVTSWNSVLKYYEFLDGTPCGKIKE